MRMLDLFSGIGGFALAAKWVWEDELDIVGFCEIEKYAQKILSKNFPGVPIYEDITKLNGKDFKNIDLITGGFPCQDISVAGKGAGLEGARSGLWTEMHRIISEVRPRFALIENVPMLIHRGLERVLCDLAEIGYDCEWQIIGADDVGAWHRRKRIWIVAYSQCLGRTKGGNKQGNDFKRKTPSEFIECSKAQFNAKDVPDTADTNDKTSKNKRRRTSVQPGRSSGRIRTRTTDVPDTNSGRIQRYRKEGSRTELQTTKSNKNNSKTKSNPMEQRWWSTEPNVGRVANGIPNRVDRLKGLGNAIVPQVAQIIMERIKESGGK